MNTKKIKFVILSVLLFICFIKYNSNALAWEKTFGESATIEFGNSVQQTADGGYVLCGIYKNSYAWVIKTDSNGESCVPVDGECYDSNIKFMRVFEVGTNSRCHSVQQTFDSGGNPDGYVIGGYALDSLGTDNALLIRTDLSGSSCTLIGLTCYDSDNKFIKVFSNATGISVQQTFDSSGNPDGYVIAGYLQSLLDTDVFLIKTDTSGNESWNKTFGDSGYDDIGYSVQQTFDSGGNPDGYVIGGINGKNNVDAWIIKTDTIGNESWNKTFATVAEVETANSIQQTFDSGGNPDGYIITGNEYVSGESKIWFVRTNLNGESCLIGGGQCYESDKKFIKYFDAGYGYSTKQTFDSGGNPDGYVIAGYNASISDDNIIVIKIDLSGNELWNKTFGSSGNDYGNAVSQTQDGEYIIVGTSYSYGSGDIILIKTVTACTSTCDTSKGKCSSTSVSNASVDGSQICCGSGESCYQCDAGYGWDGTACVLCACDGVSCIDNCGAVCADGTSCDDGDPCTSSDVCSGGSCVGTPNACDSGADGCCPPGCSYTAGDTDCPPPSTPIPDPYCNKNKVCESGETFDTCPEDCGWGIYYTPFDVQEDLEEIVMSITNWILGFISLIAVLAIIWGGVNYIGAVGDEDRIEKAKKIITYAIIGLVIAGIAYAVVYVIAKVLLK